MKKNHFIITESDRFNILSMHGLLTEDVLDYTFEGTVTSSIDKENLEYVNVSIVSDNKTIGFSVTDSEGKYSITSKLDNSKSYKFTLQDSDKRFEKIEKDINLSKTKQVINFELTSIKGVFDLKEFTLSAQRATNIDFNIKDVNGKPLTDYRLKISTNNKIILNQDFLISNPNITILKSDLVLNNLQAGTEYESDPVKNSAFNKDKNEIVEISIEVIKNGFSTFSNIFNIKSSNFVLNIPSLEKTITKGKKQEKIIFIKPNGDEEINVNKNDKNTIDVTLEVPLPEQILFQVVDQNKKVVSNANIKLEISGEIIGEYKTDENGFVSLNFKNDYVDENIFVTFEKDGYKRNIKNFKIEDKENKFKINVVNLNSSGDFNIPNELYDDLKDTNRFTYGRGKTTLSQEEAYKLAKLDIVNKYVAKRKRKYKDFPVLKNQDIDLKYEEVYRRPLKGGDEHFIILFAYNKDIRKFLKDYMNKKEDIKEPIVGDYRKFTLEESLEDSFYYGKPILVVFGVEGDELTDKVLNYVFKKNYETLSKKYTLVFVENGDNESSDDLYIIVNKNRKKLTKYPVVLTLKRPESLKQINNLEVTIEKIESYDTYTK
jgi:hypothetical protein